MKLKELKDMIESSQRIVFFGGAGVSTESGIPDFRSVDGLYQETYPYPPEVMLSHSFFHSETQEFYRFYREKMIYLQAKPNFAHKYLVTLEEQGKLSGIVTQNIDNLHTMAGSKNVFELHGNVHRNYCLSCGEKKTAEEMLQSFHCHCGGIMKPDVVLYEESLPTSAVTGAMSLIHDCDMMIIAGTSLAVYPAASFVQGYSGDKLVVINKSDLDIRCNLMIQAPVGEVFQQISLGNF